MYDISLTLRIKNPIVAILYHNRMHNFNDNINLSPVTRLIITQKW
jgi:hypothetical protein